MSMTLTKEEELTVLAAAGRTMGYIEEALESNAIGEAIELVVDADRMVNLGGLDKELYAKFCAHDYKVIVRWMTGCRLEWF